MEVEVRLFAVFRERAGRDRLALELPEGATVAEALRTLGERPELEQLIAAMPVRAALNREYVDEDARLEAGDELALIPPVSGGASPATLARVTDEPLSVAELAASVGRPGAGATVVFCGTTRDVDRLEYEAYEEMAGERISTILADCQGRHGLEAVAAAHRVGEVPLGEPSVIVAVSAAHRGEAFAGAREAIDRIKAEAPIWKQEVEGGERRWVEGAVPELTHLDSSGEARMVDVGSKPVTERRARATARVRMSPETAAAVARGDAPKGDVLGTARIAGIGAAKRTWELIPMCHPLLLTGVEMEAMTACAVAALTVYDMVKGLERGVTIEAVELVEKSGGRSGEWSRGR